MKHLLRWIKSFVTNHAKVIKMALGLGELLHKATFQELLGHSKYELFTGTLKTKDGNEMCCLGLRGEHVSLKTGR